MDQPLSAGMIVCVGSDLRGSYVMKSTVLAAVATIALVAGTAAADQFDAVLGARQGLMSNLAFNMAPLGAMVKGEAPYSADRAKMLATNLQSLSQVNLSEYWPKGTDNVALVDRTAALPAIWESGSKIGEKVTALKAAMADLAKEAGNGPDALKTSFTAAGKSCGGCHTDYRQKQN